jgi:ferredoxin--NADP+ reductase
MYATEHLLENLDIEVAVDLFDRLPNPWGLIRNGVAPDHPEKKEVVDRSFAYHLRDARVRFFGGVEIGRDLSHAELSSCYDAVIYAVGAHDDKRLGIPGEGLAGSYSARQFVSWYNGHPDFADLKFDFSGRRAVIIGNGNVALDVARILTLPNCELKRTDIADHALDALLKSRIEEVVVLGRRGPEYAAFHNPELEELEHLRGVDVCIEPQGFDEARAVAGDPGGFAERRKLKSLDRIRQREHATGGKRILLRFQGSPVAIIGPGKVEQVKIEDNRPISESNGAHLSTIECGLVIRAAGYRVTPFPDLPFDEARAVIANERGRVGRVEAPLPGTYVTGWAKRGCKGVIGSNKKCARESVDALFADIASGRIQKGAYDADETTAAVLKRCPRAVSRSGWGNIDRSERNAGRLVGRPRVKVTDMAQMLALAAEQGK